MGLVLWIDENTFASSLFEKVFKQTDLPFYTVPSAKDFGHLIKDLGPELIVVDARTAVKDLPAFKKQYEETNGFEGRPVVLVDALPGLEFLTNIKGEIKRPIAPFELPELLKKLIMKE